MRIAVALPRTLPIRRLGVNSFWLLLARVSALLLSIILTALIARRMGAAMLGRYSLIVSLVYLANVVTTFGTDSLLIREVGQTRRRDSTLVPSAFWLQVSLSLLLIGFAFAWNDGTLALPLFSLSLLPLALYSVVSAVLRGFERMDLFLLLNLFASACQLLAGVFVLLMGGDLYGLLAALVVAQTVTAALAWVLSRRYTASLGFALRIPPTLGTTLVAALPFALLTSSAVINQRLGIFALSAMAGNDATGWFSAAARIVEGLKIVPQALLGAILPLMAFRARTLDTTEFYRTSIRLALVFCFAAALLAALLAAPIVTLIYGERFAPTIGALSILAWSLVPFAVTSNITVEMVAHGQEWQVLGGTIASVALALPLFGLLVPQYGVMGASSAAVVAEMAQAVLFWLLRRSSRR